MSVISIGSSAVQLYAIMDDERERHTNEMPEV